jgi:hypothetical protein
MSNVSMTSFQPPFHDINLQQKSKAAAPALCAGAAACNQILYGTSLASLEANREVHAAVVMMVVSVMVMAMVSTPVAIVAVVRITVPVMVRESRAIVATVMRRVMSSIAMMAMAAAVPPAMAGFGLVRDAHSCRGQSSNERERQQRTLQHLSLLAGRFCASRT